MKNKKGNVVVIAIIIVIVAITASVITWLIATRAQTLTTQPATIQSQQVSQTQPAEQPKTPAEMPVLENKDTSWKLISGKSDDSCTGIVYEGNATIKGWYIWDTGYAEKEWMLKISNSDINKLPIPKAISDSPEFNQKVKLVDASPELEKELKVATKENPKEVTLKGYYLYCEGSPSVSIAPAADSFKRDIEK